GPPRNPGVTATRAARPASGGSELAREAPRRLRGQVEDRTAGLVREHEGAAPAVGAPVRRPPVPDGEAAARADRAGGPRGDQLVRPLRGDDERRGGRLGGAQAGRASLPPAGEAGDGL